MNLPELLIWLVMTCRAYGLRAIDGPFGDFKDPDAYVASAKRAAAIGIEGKWAIHPSQIDLANKVFSPPATEVDRAKKILEELAKAAKTGKGAAQLDGRMIDAASARMAENIVNINKLIESKIKAKIPSQYRRRCEAILIKLSFFQRTKGTIAITKTAGNIIGINTALK